MTIGLPSLEQVIPQSLPYTIRGAVIRLVRATVAYGLATGGTLAANGLLALHLSPEEYLLASGVLGAALQGLDKYLREKQYEEDPDNPEIPGP